MVIRPFYGSVTLVLSNTNPQPDLSTDQGWKQVFHFLLLFLYIFFSSRKEMTPFFQCREDLILLLDMGSPLFKFAQLSIQNIIWGLIHCQFLRLFQLHSWLMFMFHPRFFVSFFFCLFSTLFSFLSSFLKNKSIVNKKFSFSFPSNNSSQTYPLPDPPLRILCADIPDEEYEYAGLGGDPVVCLEDGVSREVNFQNANPEFARPFSLPFLFCFFVFF